MKSIRIYGFSLLLCGSLTALAQQPAVGQEKNTETQSQQVQTRTVKGRVLSTSTGAPLAGAMVSTTGISGYSVLTGEDGTYELQVPCFASSITVSAPGHNLVRRGLSSDSSQRDVSLLPSTLKADYIQSTFTISPETIYRIDIIPWNAC